MRKNYHKKAPVIQNRLAFVKYPSPKTKWCFYHRIYHTNREWYVLEQVKPNLEDNILGVIPFSCIQLKFLTNNEINSRN